MHALKCRHRKRFGLNKTKSHTLSENYFQVRFKGLQNYINRGFYQFETILLHESFPQTDRR